jgi:lipopolysaccharide export system protein LptC
MTEVPPPPAGAGRDDEARVAAEAQRWRAHSRRVRLLRRVLPIVILTLAGGALTWTVFRTVMSGVERRASETQEVALENARFQGQDAQGRPFVIGAGGAVRDPATGRFRLVEPVVRLNLGGRKALEMTAEGGAYDESSRRVIIGPNVRISDGGSGFTLRTPEAVVDTRTGVVTGDKGIEARGPLGTVTASAYAIHDEGRRVVFRGSQENRVAGVFRAGRG